VAKVKRNYQAEYLRRLERGRARGLTRSQARGHARAQEASLKAKPVSEASRPAVGPSFFASLGERMPALAERVA
jgi:hypothetical protein